jgi:hypothetical protein
MDMTNPKFTLRVYTHMMRRGGEERQALLDLVEGKGFRHQKAPVPKTDRIDAQPH